MDDIPSPRELRTAARACVIMAYAAGLAGIAAGTLILREGDLVFAIITWVITFAVGASLMGVAVLVRAMGGLTARLARVDADVRVLVADDQQAGSRSVRYPTS
ncbi:MAG: hypothetical protein WD576_01795 [Nitriliruptoraceae bacterium]